MDLRSERGSATRQLVLGSATDLFAAHGYDDVSIDMVLKACGISKGALYHHFRGKEALFTAVLEGVEKQVVAAVGSASLACTNPLDALRAGCGAWLGLVASDAAVRRVAVIDAPSVLGWQAWRALEAHYALGLLRGAFDAAAASGCLLPSRADIYANLLLAVLNELAMLVARAEDRGQAILIAKDAAELVISRLIGVAPGAPWRPAA